MARVNPSEFAEKLSRRLKQSQTDISRGVQAVTEAPTEKAAKKIDKMRARLLEAIDSGKVERGLRRVDLETWRNMMTEKGIPRIADGIDRAIPKIEEFASEILPYIDKAKSELSNMPDVTLEDNIQRMSTFIRRMAQFKRSR